MSQLASQTGVLVRVINLLRASKSGDNCTMVVTMKSGTQYIISEKRGKQLAELLRTGIDKEEINLDGNGKYVKTSDIETVMDADPTSLVRGYPAELWKEAVRLNAKEAKLKGKWGTWTPEKLLQNRQASA